MVIIGSIDYVVGYLKRGHFELNLDEEDLEKFNNLTEEEKRKFLKENGDLLIDDYIIDDFGDITDIYEI